MPDPTSNSDFPTTARGAARRYLRLGLSVIPIPAGSKAPIINGWNTRPAVDDLDTHFPRGKMLNIGILTGKSSHGLVDVDLDCQEAIRAATVILPPTGWIHGRLSSPRSHHWYRVESPPDRATTKYRDLDGSTIVELRSTGGQTVVPPSIHPTGELLAWEEFTEPAEVPLNDLQQAVREVASAALFARFWPERGSRNDTTLALAGALLRAGWVVGAVERFVTAVATATADEEAAQRIQVVQATVDKLEAGEPVSGWPTLVEQLGNDGAKVVKRVQQWLAIAGSATPTPLPDAGTLLSTVKPEAVSWLWPGRIPLGKLTILDGDPGLGKSVLTMDLAGRVSAGLAMPDGTPCNAAGVVILNAEDGLADTILPRLLAAGGDPTRVLALSTVLDGDTERLLSLPADLPFLDAAIRRMAASLVIIDPLMAWISGTHNTHRDQDCRRALHPLAKLAEETGAAVVVVRHLNKMAGGNPLYRGGGSIGIIGAARSGLLVGKDPDNSNIRVLASTKANLAKMPPALAFDLSIDDQGRLRVGWRGETAHTAEGLLAIPESGEEKNLLHDAMSMLRDLLAGGPVSAEEVKKEARKAIISEITLKRAKAALGVRSQLIGFGKHGRWHWSLPETPEIARGDHPSSNEPLWSNSTAPGPEILRFSRETPREDHQDTEGIITRGDHGPVIPSEGLENGDESTDTDPDDGELIL